METTWHVQCRLSADVAASPAQLLDHLRPPKRDEEPPRKRRKTQESSATADVDEADAILLASEEIHLVCALHVIDYHPE